MPRKLFKALLPVAALGCIAVGSTIAWSNSAAPTGDMTSPPVTQAAAPMEAAPMIDADQARIEAPALPARENPPAPSIKVDFNQAFADATALPQRNNTPSNREKLRTAGWARIIGPQ